ncbi:putative two-component system sensor kinase [Actinoplanes sp. N902-109]|nr:putative two-component system sensor kinase [Actinoplanes sp. N902-109]
MGLLGFGLLAGAGLALAAGRRTPVAVLIGTGLCTVGYQDRAMTKLHARDRAQLVVIAYQSGLVTPDRR